MPTIRNLRDGYRIDETDGVFELFHPTGEKLAGLARDQEPTVCSPSLLFVRLQGAPTWAVVELLKAAELISLTFEELGRTMMAAASIVLKQGLDQEGHAPECSGRQVPRCAPDRACWCHQATAVGSAASAERASSEPNHEEPAAKSTESEREGR